MNLDLWSDEILEGSSFCILYGTHQISAVTLFFSQGNMRSHADSTEVDDKTMRTRGMYSIGIPSSGRFESV